MPLPGQEGQGAEQKTMGDTINDVGMSLTKIAEAVQQSQLPPELGQKAQEILEEYTEFVENMRAAASGKPAARPHGGSPMPMEAGKGAVPYSPAG